MMIFAVNKISHSQIIASSAILQDFYTQSALTYREDFMQIEQDMVANDFVATQIRYQA